MKKNIGLIVLAIGLIVLIAGATLLYNNLSKEESPDKLVVQEGGHDGESDIDNSSKSDENNTENITGEELTEADTTEMVEYTQAPDFTVLDKEGNQVKLSDFKGKPVVLNFWASWCGPCKMEMPDFDEVYKEYGEDIHFVMVNLTDGMRETKEGAESFIDGEGYTFPIYFDTESEAAMAYGAYSIPVTYFIDAEGNLVAQGMGALDRATLQQGIDMIFAE